MHPGSEKLEIIRLVEQSHACRVRRTLATLGILPMTFYRWYARLQTGGPEAAGRQAVPAPAGVEQDSGGGPRTDRRTGAGRAGAVAAWEVGDALHRYEEILRVRGPRSIGCSRLTTWSPSPAFIVVKAADEFKDKTTAPNQRYGRPTSRTWPEGDRKGWGWFYLSTILDDFSRFYIIAWKLCTTMKAEDADRHTEAGSHQHRAARAQPGCPIDHVCCAITVLRTSPAIWRNGWRTAASGTSGALPSIPRPRAKIERWHQTLKNRILRLENYYLPGDLETQINAFVDHYNHHRYHEAIGNRPPADVYFGRGQTILLERERIKRPDHPTQTLGDHRAIAA